MFRLIAAFYDTGPNGALVFLATTMALGGAAALASGRAVAETWRPVWQLPLYMLLLAAGVRFVQFAVLSAPLLSLRNYAIDVVVLMALGSVGYALKRRRQMELQYGWRGSAGGSSSAAD